MPTAPEWRMTLLLNQSLIVGPDAAEPKKAAPLWRAFLALRPELDRHSLPAAEADLRFSGRIVLKAPGDPGRGKT